MCKELGPYVRSRPLKGGGVSYTFEVPLRLRPEGWACSMPLLRNSGVAPSELSPEQREWLKEEALKLLLELKDDRAAETAGDIELPRTLQTLINEQEKLPDFMELKPCSQKAARKWCDVMLSWSASLGHPDPSDMDWTELESFFFGVTNSPYIRIQLKTAARRLFRVAMRLKWRPDNPVDLVCRLKQPESVVRLWTRQDVDRFVDAARDLGMEALAAILLLQWEAGQRLTDVIAFEHGLEIAAGGLRHWCSKTNGWVAFPLSPKLLELLERNRSSNHDFAFAERTRDGCYSMKSLGTAFRKVRKALGEDGEDRLQLRALRHTAVVELALAKNPDFHIASVTGHTLQSIGRILRVYLPSDSRAAWEAQARRGFVPWPEDRISRDDLILRNLNFASDSPESDDEATLAEGRRKLAQIKRLRAKQRARD